MKSVQDIVDDLNKNPAPAGGSEKTAGVPSNGHSVETARAELQGSLQNLLSAGQAKQASTSGDASQHLEKVAHDLAQADDVATIKEARLYGSAVFDGFIARANQFATTNGSATKTASTNQMAKTAAAEGYHAMDRKLALLGGRNKTAAAQENQMKTAAAEGYHAMDRKLALLGGSEKTAQQKQAEYEEGILAGLDKVAEHSIDCFERGFEHMGNLAQQMAG